MKVFDVRDITVGVDAALAVVENPRHRHMLKNYRRHAVLEVSGHWEDILTPVMTVDHPVYRITERGRTMVLDGMDEVRRFYAGIVSEGANVFGALEEQVAVSDHGVFIEAVFAQVVPGTDPALAGEDVEPSGTYQVSHHFAAMWPYREGRLAGEYIYDDSGSWRVDEVDPSALTSPAEARALLAPSLARSPLTEIEEGLALFTGVRPPRA
ncbi:hypothetical protein Skr01_49430 [Sphaerisporangium krabiense]|uniref:SnoaL-like domain-containing protein n=1 Tax=Sphaerisporangium krabiense TaxID=763782 RepID=A0A7W8Z2M5_9ACTN|nr:hypothetical protein [Sphaerisporangium krabiense]MBB5626053.1 hypothetical protein [Sphaerisporangium krabiense]GII64858.1 hypothetical protein Skr01_49430 [Sphaerisporangium krabiense]